MARNGNGFVESFDAFALLEVVISIGIALGDCQDAGGRNRQAGETTCRRSVECCRQRSAIWLEQVQTHRQRRRSGIYDANFPSHRQPRTVEAE